MNKIEAVCKEFSQSPDLQADHECYMLFKKLSSQRDECLKWIEQYDKLFNEENQFDPKDGLPQVQAVLERGDLLELRLQEFVQL